MDSRLFLPLLLGCGLNPPVEGAWSGRVSRLESTDPDGVVVCQGERCAGVAPGGLIPRGATVRTNRGALVELTLDDGSTLLLDRDTELTLDARAARCARVARGEVVAEIAEVPSSSATFHLPEGEVEVVGTALALAAEPRSSRVGVLRGSVNVALAAGNPVRVEAGQEATIEAGSTRVASRTAWDDLAAFASKDDADLVGLGELRARRPGRTDEAARELRLERHAVKVRISGLMARTEVDEVFANDGAEELEGIFRFPLPPDAQIESLTLEVNGRPMEGAFVERDRGAAIWRGVLAHAAPSVPRPKEEIIWVPGPWRDPALLEWQRGGRFELKIFPIPARGSRRVTLTYTQVVPAAGALRRYTYPLAHDASGSTRVGEFTVDAQVIGLDAEFGVTSRGYALEPESAGSAHLHYTARDFRPAGDVSLAYALPDRDQELVAWAWSGGPGGRPPVGNAELDDPSGYVALSLRPALGATGRPREDHLAVLVVDTSRSMVGERSTRARALAVSLVTEMDRRDRFELLACDETCVRLGDEPLRAGPASAARVDSFLAGLHADGGSDLAGAIRAAADLSRTGLGGVRILLLSDGTPTVGPTRPATLQAAVEAAMPPGGSVVAVALGNEADTASLAAVARGGDGVVVPYLSGRRVPSVALAVLSASYGSVLAEPTLELPPGLHAITPAALDPILAGAELLVLARLDAGRERVDGDAILRGSLAGQPYEQRYPLKIVDTRAEGNTFVPRLYAAARIAELDAGGRAGDVPTIVAWSRQMQVASRHTSLLVLESEAMFTAFGLDHVATAPLFTGEEGSVGEFADPVVASIAPNGATGSTSTAAAGMLGTLGGGRSAGDLFDKEDDVGAASAFARRGSGTKSSDLGAPFADRATTSDGKNKQAEKKPESLIPELERLEAPKRVADPAPPPRPAASRPNNRPRTWIPMRKVWQRYASTLDTRANADRLAEALASARLALAASPDSRDRTAALYRLLAATGQLVEAGRLLDAWSTRDAMDGEALLARSDLAGRLGDRDEALRILGGVADARPDEGWLHERLAGAFEGLGRPERACSHRIALAELRASSAADQGRALRCTRELGWLGLADALVAGLPGDSRVAAERAAFAPTAKSPDPGDLVIDGRWSASADLDIALIDDEGHRLSWSASTARKGRATATSGDRAHRETTSFAGLRSGTYTVEITGTDGGSAPVSGDLELTLPHGGSKHLSFTTQAGRAEVGLLKVWFESRLVEDTRVGRRVGSEPPVGGVWR